MGRGRRVKGWGRGEETVEKGISGGTLGKRKRGEDCGDRDSEEGLWEL